MMLDISVSNIKNTVIKILKFAIVIGAVSYLVVSGKLDPSNIDIQPGKSIYAFLAFGLIAITCSIAFLRWYILLKSLDVKISFYNSIRIGAIGIFFNTFMFGAFGGDLVKIGYVIKENHRRAEAVASIFTDRICGLIGLLIVGGVAIISNWQEIVDTPSLHILALALFTILALVAICMLVSILAVVAGRKITLLILMGTFLCHSLYLKYGLSKTEVSDLFFQINCAFLIDMTLAVITAVIFPSLLPGGTLQSVFRNKVPLGKKIMSFIDSFLAYRHKILPLITCIGLSIIIQSMGVLSFVPIAKTIGSKATAAHIFFAAPPTLIANVLPVPMGGLGIGEGVFDALLGFCRAEDGSAITGGAMVFLGFRFLSILFGVITGLPFYLSGKKEIDKIEQEFKKSELDGESLQ